MNTIYTLIVFIVALSTPSYAGNLVVRKESCPGLFKSFLGPIKALRKLSKSSRQRDQIREIFSLPLSRRTQDIPLIGKYHTIPYAKAKGRVETVILRSKGTPKLEFYAAFNAENGIDFDDMRLLFHPAQMDEKTNKVFSSLENGFLLDQSIGTTRGFMGSYLFPLIKEGKHNFIEDRMVFEVIALDETGETIQKSYPSELQLKLTKNKSTFETTPLYEDSLFVQEMSVIASKSRKWEALWNDYAFELIKLASKGFDLDKEFLAHIETPELLSIIRFTDEQGQYQYYAMAENSDLMISYDREPFSHIANLNLSEMTNLRGKELVLNSEARIRIMQKKSGDHYLNSNSIEYLGDEVDELQMAKVNLAQMQQEGGFIQWKNSERVKVGSSPLVKLYRDQLDKIEREVFEDKLSSDDINKILDRLTGLNKDIVRIRNKMTLFSLDTELNALIKIIKKTRDPESIVGVLSEIEELLKYQGYLQRQIKTIHSIFMEKFNSNSDLLNKLNETLQELSSVKLHDVSTPSEFLETIKRKLSMAYEIFNRQTIQFMDESLKNEIARTINKQSLLLKVRRTLEVVNPANIDEKRNSLLEILDSLKALNQESVR